MIDYDRVERVLAMRGLSYERCSRMMGAGGKFLTNARRNHSDIGASKLALLSSVTGVDPRYFMGLTDDLELDIGEENPTVLKARAHRLLSDLIAELGNELRQGGVSASLDEVMDWWSETDGDVGKLAQLRDQVDLYEAPSPTTGNPIANRAGPRSLSAKFLDIQSADDLTKIIVDLGNPLTEKTLNAHFETMIGRPHLTVESLNYTPKAHNGMARHQITYKRLLLPVSDRLGHNYVLNFSKFMRLKSLPVEPDPSDS